MLFKSDLRVGGSGSGFSEGGGPGVGGRGSRRRLAFRDRLWLWKITTRGPLWIASPFRCHGLLCETGREFIFSLDDRRVQTLAMRNNHDATYPEEPAALWPW